MSGTGDWFDFDIISSPNPEIVRCILFYLSLLLAMHFE